MLRTDRHWCGAGSRGVLNKLVVLIAATALSAIVAARGEPPAASRVGANSSKLAGAFVNWGPVGREVMLQAWEKWLKPEPSSVLGVDFYALAPWDDYVRLNWGTGWREVMLQAWEKWLKQEPSSVLGVDFYALATWDDYVRLNWVPGI